MGLHYFDKILVPNALSRNANRASNHASSVFDIEVFTALRLGVTSKTPFVNDSKVLSESVANFLLMMLIVVVRAHFAMGRCRWGYANLHSVLGFGNDIMKFNTYPSLSY